MNTVVFSFEKSGSGFPHVMPQTYPDILHYSGTFTITVNDRVFFCDGEFNIFEFLACYRSWEPSRKQAMLYNCLDTVNNPLISFVPSGDGWKILSPWQKSECDCLFFSAELVQAIEKMIKEMGY